MTSEEYAEKLRDPRWQKKRLEIFNRDNWCCQSCYDNQSTLHCHHLIYIPRRDPWDYPNDLLITLCESCHDLEKEELQSACSCLIERIQSKFLAMDIYEIASGFSQLEVARHHEVVASAIRWALSNPVIQRELTEKYFEFLKANKTKSAGHKFSS